MYNKHASLSPSPERPAGSYRPLVSLMAVIFCLLQDIRASQVIKNCFHPSALKTRGGIVIDAVCLSVCTAVYVVS